MTEVITEETIEEQRGEMIIAIENGETGKVAVEKDVMEPEETESGRIGIQLAIRNEISLEKSTDEHCSS